MIDAVPARPLLLLGASGAVGRFVLRRLANQQVPVLAASRQPPPPWSSRWHSVEWCRGSLEGGLPLPSSAQSIDVLSAGPLDALADWLPQASIASGSRLVALSSMSAEWKRQSPNPGERRLAVRLLDAEQRLQKAAAARDIGLMLLRPTLIWGAGIDRSLSSLLAIARRGGRLPWPAGGNGLRQPVHADDVAAALLAALQCDAVAAPLPLPGAEPLPFDRLLERLLQQVLPTARLMRLPLPRALLRACASFDNRIGRAAVPFFRSFEDQLASDHGWPLLGVQPRAFDPRPDDFLHW